MERREEGEVVPIPTKPEDKTLRRLPVEPTNRVEVAIKDDAVVVPVI